VKLTRRSVLAASALAACGPARAPENIARLGVALEPPHLDPTAGAAAAIDEVVYANVFEGLTGIGPDGAVRPALAARWEIGDGGRDYVFHLHPNVRYHDGAPFSADDVVFSLDRARAPDSVNAQKELFEPIAEAVALDPLRVRVRLKRPDGAILNSLGGGDAVIVSRASAAHNMTHPIGTGPFRFDRWARGALISLTRNDAYWGTPARLNGVTIRTIPDASAGYAALMADDVDGFPDFPAPELLPQIKRDGRFRVAIGVTEGETILAMNNGRAPFNDLRVRRAISHAIDRRAVNQGGMFGYGTPIGTHFSPAHPAYLDLTGQYPYDPARARTLLAEAGYPNGFRTTIALPPPAYARRGGEVVAAQLRAVGIIAEIRNIEWAQWLDQVFANKDFDLTIISHTEPMDIGIYARDDYYFDYHSDAFKAIMARLGETGDPATRTRLLQEAQRRISDDAVNVFLFQLPKIGVWRKELQGVWVNSPVQANDLTAAYWDDGR